MQSPAGNDTLTGGAGQDLFVFSTAAEHGSVITDFHLGEDMLDLRGAVADAGYRGAGAHDLVTLHGVQASQLKAGTDFLWH